MIIATAGTGRLSDTAVADQMPCHERLLAALLIAVLPLDLAVGSFDSSQRLAFMPDARMTARMLVS